MIKLKEWEKLAFQSLPYLAAEPWGDADIQSVFQKPKAIIIVLAFLKAGFNKKNPARVLLA